MAFFHAHNNKAKNTHPGIFCKKLKKSLALKSYFWPQVGHFNTKDSTEDPFLQNLREFLKQLYYSIVAKKEV